MSTYLVTAQNDHPDSDWTVDVVIGIYEEEGKLGSQKAAEKALNQINPDEPLEVNVYRIELTRRYRGQLQFTVERIDGDEDDNE